MFYRVRLSDDDQAASLQDLLEGCLQLLLTRYLPCYFLPSIILTSYPLLAMKQRQCGFYSSQNTVHFSQLCMIITTLARNLTYRISMLMFLT